MIDHVLGRPSTKFRKYQVFAVIAVWSTYLHRGNRHGPPILRALSQFFSKKLTAWQTVVLTLLYLYVFRDFGKVVGLESPEPLANLYNRSYFRATWITTALDAGFWTAMRIRPKWARDFMSMVFSVYYLVAAEKADEKVRKVRGVLTVDHLRVSWNKPLTPYLKLITTLMRPRFMRYAPRAIRIPRPRASVYTEPVHAWLYYDGPLSELKHHDKVIMDIPGGGFVAMSPRTHDDKLMAWAGKTGIPVLSLDYKKAPEFPYPYALNECYDVYHMLHASKGRCIGLSGDNQPKVVLSGDSAGGNLATAMLLMVLQAVSIETRRWHGEEVLPIPESVILIYPALDVNIGNWMTDEQMSLINDRQQRKANKSVLRHKSEDYRKLTPSTPHHSDEELEDDDSSSSPKVPQANGDDSVVTVINATNGKSAVHPDAAHTTGQLKDSQPAATAKPRTMKTRLAMSSMISYFNDRILTPEMMRAMIILYVGPHNRPDFSTDFLLSPVLAPENLLALFPKTYIMTGERDPLVDDTVIFAGRLRQAHRARHLDRQEIGLEKASRQFREESVVEVALIPGISHGFLQFAGIFPEGWKYIDRCADWIIETFDRSSHTDEPFNSGATTPADPPNMTRQRSVTWDGRRRHHHRMFSATSSGDEDRPLEMTRINSSGSNGSGPKVNGSGTSEVSKGKQKVTNGRVGRQTLRARRAKRQKSLVSLASSDDLLGRRMKGLAGGLMGMEGEGVPPTP